MQKGSFKSPLDVAIVVVALAMVAYQATATQISLVSPAEHWNIHLFFALVLVFLVAARGTMGWLRWTALAALALSIVGTGYVFFNFEELDSIFDYPNTIQIIIGIVLVVVVLEGVRRVYGLTLPILALVCVVYAFFGNYLPGPFQTARLRPEMLISRLSIGISGIYGVVLGVSSNYIFLFIVFGSLLQAAGATRFFLQVGRLFGKRLKGGPALAAVFCSLLMGMVTGGPSANVAVVGPFTIPLMKKVGYSPVQAGAIEAVASTGGAFMPPVMGAVAFVMAGFTGIPYIRICAVAIIPALLYYFSAALYVQFQAMKLNVLSVEEKPDKREMLLSGPVFFLPLIVLTVLLIMGKTPMYAIFWTLLATVATGIWRKETRPSLRGWVTALTEGAVGGVHIAVVCAMVGLIVTPIVMTGLGIKLPGIVEVWSMGSLTLALLITMVVSIIIGTGLPTTPTYILVAIITAPVLQKMGITTLQAHFFCFYFAVLGFITPPEAMAALVSSKVAGAPFMRTGWEAVKVGLGGFLVPFLGIWAPITMLAPESAARGAIDIPVIVALFVAMQAVICDYYLTRISVLERVALVASFLFMLTFLILNSFLLLGIGGVLFVVITLQQLLKRLKARPVAGAAQAPT